MKINRIYLTYLINSLSASPTCGKPILFRGVKLILVCNLDNI
jgi:hypothetical protein